MQRAVQRIGELLSPRSPLFLLEDPYPESPSPQSPVSEPEPPESPKSQMDTREKREREPIAIVGSACRFAGEATSPSDLWRLLRAPQELSKEIPADRFNIKGFYHPEGEHNGTTDSPKAYFLEQSHKVFDAGFFNILPKEAEAIDPQQRLLLEVVYEALESAGYPLHKYDGKNVAVYAGIMTADYDTVSQRDDLNTSQYYATGNARSIVANRISYFFNFGGPSMTIDTACSSSLVALDQAVNNLRAGKCDMACVTGANLILTPEQFIAESSLHMLSPAGHCRMWDTDADGYARGEGVAAIFVKPLSKALADGDRIEAVIREIGVNSDGRTKGITMPSWSAQAQLIKSTYHRAGLDPTIDEDRCQFFEAHGTGTKAGDPNEARAIQTAFFGPLSDLGEDGDTVHATGNNAPGTEVADGDKLLVGSIKTVVGHTEGAAGLAGLLKVVQSIQNRQIPPNLHLEKLAPAVAAVSPNLKVVTQLQDWPQLPDGVPKRASVNSFGFGGTNSHIIVEEYLADVHDKLLTSPIPEKHDDDDVAGGSISLPLTLSGTSKQSLCDVLIGYRNYVFRNKRNSDWNVNDVGWHTYARRTALPFRAAVAGDGIPLVQKLNLLIDQLDVKGKDKESRPTEPEVEVTMKLSGPGPLIARTKGTDEQPRILGVFTGQGSQWATMSKHLLETNQTYADTIRLLDGVLKGLPDGPSWSLESEIKAGSAMSRVNQAEVSQPLCTAVQLGILAIFRKLKIKLHAVVGHSSGEIAAAHAAGRLRLQDAIVIAYYRGRFAHRAQGVKGEKGGMAVVGISEEEAKHRFEKYEEGTSLTVAAINQTELVTISGNKDAVEKFIADLIVDRGGVFNRHLEVDVAYHSAHMKRASEPYLKALNDRHIDILTPSMADQVAWVSSVSEKAELQDIDLKEKYWVDNMELPVRFQPALEEVKSKYGPFDCVVEIGPRPSLKSAVTRVLVRRDGKPLPYCGVLETGVNDTVAFADFLGWMWLQFGSAQNLIHDYLKDSSEPQMHYNRLKDPPVYPWDHDQSYYRESRVCRQYHFRADAPHELLGIRTRDDDEYLLRWRNVLKLDQIKWGTGHTFQGAHLVPGSGYCSMAYDAAKVFLGLSGRTALVIELVDLHFYSGITLAANSPGVETLFSLTIDESPKTFTRKAQSVVEGVYTLTSCPADGTTTMKKNFGGKLRIILGDPSLDALPARIKAEKAPETAHADPAAFYQMMHDTGLTYTGPFRGLTALQKRTNFASGTVRQLHGEDKTELTVSPATLDSCLQTAFVTVSSPGDKALWTSFLPDTIDRMRFNVASCEGKSNTDILNVDAYLTDANSFSTEAAASFTADIEIFGKDDRLQIQVQGLTVASFSTTKPEDDYELYLTTVWDLDPDVEIVTAEQPSKEIEDESANPVLLESCERVASFYANKRSANKHVKLPPRFDLNKAALPVNGWPDETQETIDGFISASPFFSTLDFVRLVGNKMPGIVYGMLPDIITEAQHLMRVQNHVSRIVKQIAHKYPRMHVLGWTDDDLALTAHILNGLDDAFLSYRVGGEVEKDMQERLLTIPARKKKVAVKHFDPDEARAETDTLYELVVVTTAMMDDPKMLGKVHRVMRPGGFLVWVDCSVHLLSQRLKEDEPESDEGPNDFRADVDKYGFVHNMHHSYQTFRPSYSVLVCQAKSKEKEAFRFPFMNIEAHTKLVDRILVVGGKQPWTQDIERGIRKELGPYCSDNVMTYDSLERMTVQELAKFPVVILLSDIDTDQISAALATTGILNGMTAKRMDVMQALLSPERKIIWVTFNARIGIPENAASLGFVRTVLAETPSLRIQILDLTSINGKSAVGHIKDTFARLVLPSPDAGKTGNEKPHFINETEVYIQDGRPTVARCLPWKAGNNRNNAPRRIVTEMHNSLEKAVQVSYVEKKNGSTGYEIEVGDADSLSLDNPQPETIRVDYSTADALNLGDKTAYVWLGRDLVNDKVHVGLSNSNASYLVTALTATAVWTSQTLLAQINQALFVGLVARYLAAIALAEKLEGRSLVLLEPDEVFLDCARDVLVERNIYYLVLSTDSLRCGANPNLTFVHANASIREIKALYPPGIKVQVVDMLPEGSEISRVLKSNLPKGSKYDAGYCLLAQENDKIDASGYPEADWREALGLAVARVKQYMDKSRGENPAKADLITVPALTQTWGQLPPFRVLDWRAERSVAKMLMYFPKPVLSANKVYIIVGITRDFGQSLCHLFAVHGARHIVLCSRSPPVGGTKWQRALKARGVNVEFRALDVTNQNQVIKLRNDLVNERRLIIGGIINGAMVLEDKVFSEMSVETLRRVMKPKTDGSWNLHTAFENDLDVEFFIMTSSFAAVGGHAGQSNYAAANMYMNGLAAKRRSMGKPGCALNIGVIYGIGFLHREKSELYKGLEREGYPPISERDIHHMFIEALEAGKPGGDGKLRKGDIYDVVTGLARYEAGAPQLDWQYDPRFSHYTKPEEAKTGDEKEGGKERSIKELIDAEEDAEKMFDILLQRFLTFLADLLGLDPNHVNADSNISSLGVDSLTAVEIRRWFYKGLTYDVAVMKILDASSIKKLCQDAAAGIMANRLKENKENEENGSVPPPDHPAGGS